MTQPNTLVHAESKNFSFPKEDVLRLNGIWWWYSSSETLRNVESIFCWYFTMVYYDSRVYSDYASLNWAIINV